MNILIIVFMAMTFNAYSQDQCDPIKAIPSIDQLVKQKGNEYCPGGCQTHYKIPKNDKQNIWYKGNCFRINNSSTINPIFVPAKNLELYSAGSQTKFHTELKCVGDFYHTKEDEAKSECKRNVSVSIDKCPNPKVVEEVEAICDPGCSYMDSWQEIDNSTTPPSQITKTGKKIKGGSGNPCTYYKKIKLVWEGISNHDPNNSSDVIVKKIHIIDENFDRIVCRKEAVNCSVSNPKGEGTSVIGPNPPQNSGEPEKAGDTTVSP